MKDIVVMQCPHCGRDITKPDGRTKGKITDALFGAAVRASGPGAMQKDVARTLGVSEQALMKWRRARGFGSWRDVKEHFMPH